MGVGAARGEEDGETTMTTNNPPLLKSNPSLSCRMMGELGYLGLAVGRSK